MKVVVLTNPAAGAGDDARRELREALSAAGVDAEITQVAGDQMISAARKAREQQVDAVVAASGLDTVPGRLRLEGDIMKTVDARLGALARPQRVLFVAALPKTRSGKLLRRAIQAVCEGRDPGDLTTIEDPGALQALREVVAAG